MPRRLFDFVPLVFAGGLYAVALKYFVLPSRVILTGTEGIASSLSYYFESDALFIILYLVFQLALFLFALKFIGRAFALRTLAVVVTVVAGLAILPDLQIADPGPTNERILLVLFGGLLAGAAKAIAFERRGSTGDEDVIGAYFALKFLKPVGSIAIISAAVSTRHCESVLLMTVLSGDGSFRRNPSRQASTPSCSSTGCSARSVRAPVRTGMGRKCHSPVFG